MPDLNFYTAHFGQAMQQTLAVMSTLEDFQAIEKPGKERLQVDQIAVWLYAPSRYMEFIAALKAHQPVETVEVIRYAVQRAGVPVFTCYVPDAEWHMVLAAKDLGRNTVEAKVKGCYPINLDLFRLDEHGLWIDQLNGWHNLRAGRTSLSPQALMLLRAFGMRDPVYELEQAAEKAKQEQIAAPVGDNPV